MRYIDTPLGSGRVLRYADIDLAAVAQRGVGRDRQLILWYVLRSLDSAGAGRIVSEDVNAATHFLQMSHRRARQLVAGGINVFWTSGSAASLHLRSAPRVAAAFGIASFRAAFRSPVRDFRGSLTKVRGRLVIRAVAALRAGRPIANATIAQLAGVKNVRTVQRWRTMSDIRSSQNFVLVAPLRPGTIAGDFCFVEPALRTVRFGGRRWMARRIADSLDVPRSGGVRSHLRRGNRRLRAFSADCSGDPACRRGDPSRVPVYQYKGVARQSTLVVHCWSQYCRVST